MAEVLHTLFSPAGFVLLLASIGFVILKFALSPYSMDMFNRRSYTALRDANDAKLRESFDLCHRKKSSSIEEHDSSNS